MESSTASTNEEEPLDLSLTNHGSQEMTEEQQQQIVQFLEAYGAAMQQNMLALLLRSCIESQVIQPPIPEEPPEMDTKENILIPKLELMLDENESTPSPRRTSTGKIDRRMIGKVCSRRVEANARERNRVQTLSKTFEELKICLPIDDDVKISKLATLKVASAYIGFLGAILGEDREEEDRFHKKLLAEMESAKAMRK